jgi:hypothetical protein
MTQSEFHRYRIEVIESWLDCPEKKVALAAARAAFECELAFEHTRSRRRQESTLLQR